MYFEQRMPEPEQMEALEDEVFAEVNKEHKLMWYTMLVDHVRECISSSPKNVLDVGAGPGYLVEALAESFPQSHVAGVDISEKALEIAKETTKQYPFVELKQGSVDTALPYEDNTFEIVVSRDSFHHFPDAERALREMLRVLAPGGVLYIQDLRRDLPQEILDMALPRETVFQKLQYYSVRASYTLEEMEQLCNSVFGHTPELLESRVVTPDIRTMYAPLGVDMDRLAVSFAAHYVLVIRK
jgi:ubiquinone/menaquinone biosynthesis C-methylase UbiE